MAEGRGYRLLRRLGGAPVARIARWLRGRVQSQSARTLERTAVDHVILLDGTLSSLEPGMETNVGLTWRLLEEARRQGHGAHMSLYYEAGIQWGSWKHTWQVASGKGINRQIRRAYGVLATRYRPGDRIFLIGYSRGAFAVRSMAGLIDRVGLLRPDAATERNIVQAYRHYEAPDPGAASVAFRAAHCHEGPVPIEMIGVWDTVKALGLTWPLVWRLFDPVHRFHDAALGPNVRNAYHALARDETRVAYEPVLWDSAPGDDRRIEQVWFPGTHGDVGGQLAGKTAARPLANISLIWMLARIEAHGLPLPEGWAGRFPCDAAAPSIGRYHGWGKTFVLRRRRRIGRDRSERVWQPGEPLTEAGAPNPSVPTDLPTDLPAGERPA